MPSHTPVNHAGRTIGCLTVIGPAEQKRTWRVRCQQGHVTERRIDILLQRRPESLTCTECTRKPADLELMEAAFRNFITTLAPVQRAALGRVLTLASSMAT